MSYDRYDWHSGGDFPDDIPEENGGTHIGMFLAWAISKDLISDLFKEDTAESLGKIRRKEITGRDYLLEMCDGKFWEDILNEEGNAFTQAYYNNYLGDYVEILATDHPSPYHVEDTWENFDILKPHLDKTFDAWRKPPAKQRWKFWK